jgi:uncharacterized membrane protein
LLLVALLISDIYLFIRLLDRPAEPFIDEQRTLMDGVLPFGLLLIGMGVLLTLGPEFVYLKDVFGQRLNTIFKFYYQAWILFGVVAVYGLDYLLRHFRIAGILTTAVYGVALFVSLLFPWFAVQSRSIEYRGSLDAADRSPATLDGLAYLERFNPDDLDAILWMRQNLNEPAIIVEAIGGSYTGYARVSASTGVPTVLGWPGHEYQWRGKTSEPGDREPAVEAIYSPLDWQQTADLLNQYDVDYIYYGPLERDKYDQGAAEKFSRNMEIAYSNDSVSIYRWQPSKED